jgi:hypothetical protein
MKPRTFQADTPLQALLLEQALIMARKIEQTAAAPDGRVLADLEAAAVPAGRELARLAVQSAAQAQAPAAEKKRLCSLSSGKVGYAP